MSVPPVGFKEWTCIDPNIATVKFYPIRFWLGLHAKARNLHVCELNTRLKPFKIEAKPKLLWLPEIVAKPSDLSPFWKYSRNLFWYTWCREDLLLEFEWDVKIGEEQKNEATLTTSLKKVKTYMTAAWKVRKGCQENIDDKWKKENNLKIQNQNHICNLHEKLKFECTLIEEVGLVMNTHLGNNSCWLIKTGGN